MRRFLTLALVLIGACGADETEAEVTVAAEPGDFAVEVDGDDALPAAAHDGVVIGAGPSPLEVVTQDDGVVEAYVVGEPLDDPAGALITVHVPVAEGPPRPTVLVWDPGRARFRGRVHGVAPAPGPLRVDMTIGGRPYRARGPEVVIVHSDAPRADVDVEVDEGPDVVVERPGAPRAQVVVERPAPPSAQVVVEHPDPRPRARVEVRGPAPPPGPRVEAHGPHPPPPGGVRVEARGPRVSKGRGRVRVRRRGRHRRRGRRRGRRR